MSEGLFGSSSFGDVAPTQPKPEEKKRRVKLFPWDSVATQLLEPFGESSFDTMSLDKLWTAAARGNRSAAYHSHLCAPQDTDGWRVGAGVSLTAAALLAAIRKFRSDDMKQLIKEDLYTKVERELRELEPTLKKLNMGKGSQNQRDAGSFRDVREAKRQKTTTQSEAPATTPDEMKEAAVAFHKWLKRDQSPFRSLLYILAGSNTYYTGHVAETVARAAVACKPMSEADIQAAMIARMSQPPEQSAAPGAASSSTGLFEL